ncbi:MAG: hypothetical protein A2Y33_09260 [Spirochaetes bacterium GWF1_51_8]|nr:MAG: hypothetical protein A2Y33_09260 [Spirochaetes bacterium GWF1_51_8]
MNNKVVKIAFIESNPRDAEQIIGILENPPAGENVRFDFQFTIFDKLNAARKALNEEQFDLILLDLLPEEKQGSEAFVFLAEYVQKIPTIILSGSEAHGPAMDAVNMGAQDCLIKDNADYSSLTRSITYAAERHRLAREFRENEAKLKSIYTQAPIGIAIYDENGSPAYINDIFITFFGIADPAHFRTIKLFDSPFITLESAEILHSTGSVKYEKKMDFCKIPDISNKDCVSYFSVAINRLKNEDADGLSGYLATLQDITSQKETQNQLKQFNEKIRTELKFAARLQQSMEPERMIDNELYRIYTSYYPCEEIGGDYLEIIKIDELIFIISGDVSGHGLIAALFTFLMRGIIRTILAGVIDTQTLLEKVAVELNDYLIEGYFITMSVLLIDPEERMLYYTRAGHPPFIIYNPRRVEMVGNRSSFISPIFTEHKWDTGQIQLEIDDRIFLFTDGLFEIQDSKTGDLLGVSYILNLVEQYKSLNPTDMIEKTVHHLREIYGQKTFEDDISIMVYEPK